jgi:CDP-glycerol glycerophosphotransferase (TagB/SpsB family)
MLAYAQTHPEIDIVFRPHPFLFGTMTDREVMTQEQVDSWRSRWDALPNTFTDLGIDMPALLLASDAMLTDGVSFLAEYPLVTGKPAIFWEKPEHWQFSPLGALAAASTVTVRNMAEVEHALDQARSGTLPDRTSQIQELIAAVRPQPRSAAEAIIDLIVKDVS